MSEFLKDPISLIIIAFIAFSFLSAVLYQLKVRRNGIEAEATVTAIIENDTTDGEGMPMTTYDIHVSYRMKDGTYVEGTLSNPNQSLYTGQTIRIKYLESDPETPVYIGQL
ncbi:MAG: hypothetical protein IKG46_10500 [Solobacterium sp.]|nr:hypothetical protein [Solobacterium sp.]